MKKELCHAIITLSKTKGCVFMPSVCVAYKKCGGCQYTGVPYPEQLEMKQKNEEALLGRFGRVERILGMRYPCFYRNKVTAAFGKDKKGNIICGTYQEGTHYIVQVEKCLIEDEKCQEIIRTIKSLLKGFKMEPFNEDTGKGLLRHVLVRRGIKTGEIMVVLVLGTHIFPSGNNFVKELLKRHPEISTVVVNINERKTSMVLGEREKISYGKGYITDELCGCRFRISPSSFYQINPVQTEVLYNKAVEFAGLTGEESVIDAYCGIGTIGMVAAKHAKNVIGVELNSAAVRDARINAKENKIENIEFFRGDAGDFMMKMAAGKEKADVVFMDPPRAGSTEEFLAAVKTLGPKKVVYVSCNPATLARDLEFITKNGYEVKKIQPVDMFPFTDHCETVVLLTAKEKKPFEKKTYDKKGFDKKPQSRKTDYRKKR
ncbi:MAG: 23S rRNA (uracil(1939)-C(5))-methyltransferase RlmD [Oscillospiraceae bacterium]|nr:23S rRNA (uracil(1939)-C(5))-methyltransferase RlmD [Oscillospiraceae bacterium]